MLKKTITYTDYNGNERKEDFYFNLSKAELTRMEFMAEGGLENKIMALTNKMKGPEIYKIFEEIVTTAVGEKSDDGKRFIKSDDISQAFMQCPAYDELLMEILSSEQSAAAFIEGIMPVIPEDHKPPKT